MAKLNTAIRGAQIATAVAGNGLEWTDDNVMGLDLKASGGLKIDTGELTVEPADFAGKGVKDDGSDNLDLDINGLDAAGVDAANDSIAILDATDSESKKESIADLATAMAGDGLAAASGAFSVDLNELTGAAVDVAADSIAIVDANDGNASRKEAIADLVTAMAGSGLTATSGVLSADAITDNITEADILFEDESANCDSIEVNFTISETPIANSVQVYLTGLLQQEGSGKDYTISGTTITFAVAPDTGDLLLIHYIRDN